MPTIDRILPFAKYLLEKAISPGDIVVDATTGNGSDTVYLSSLVGNDGQVYAFDVQADAIQSTRRRLSDAKISNVELIQDGHENALQYISKEISASIFNLGYLPGSDMSITTTGNTTWRAVTDLLSITKKGGIIILVIYRGHEEGREEQNFIEEKISTLDPGETAVLKYEFWNKNNAPYIIAIERMKHKKG
jgi:predicted methyltransferase